MTTSIPEAKARLRTAAQAARARAAASGEAAAAEVRRRVIEDLDPGPTQVVSGYWPLKDELDPRPAMAALAAMGHSLCLPVVVGRDRPLVFRAWDDKTALQPAAFGTMVPGPDCPVLEPELLLVPLLAFDRRGFRLGYGGGFYDRSLAGLRAWGRATAVGVAFAAQEVPEVPIEAADEKLDWIVTERESLRLAD